MKNKQILDALIMSPSFNPRNLYIYINASNLVDDAIGVVSGVSRLILSRGRDKAALASFVPLGLTVRDIDQVIGPLWRAVTDAEMLSMVALNLNIVFDRPLSYDDLLIRFGYEQTDSVSLHYIAPNKEIKRMLSVDKRFKDIGLRDLIPLVSNLMAETGVNDKRVKSLLQATFENLEEISLHELFSTWFLHELGRERFFSLDKLSDFGKLSKGVFDLSENETTLRNQLMQRYYSTKAYKRYLRDNEFMIRVLVYSAQFFVNSALYNKIKPGVAVVAFKRFCDVGSFGLLEIVGQYDSVLQERLTEFLAVSYRARKANGAPLTNHDVLLDILWPVFGARLIFDTKE